MKIRLLVLDEQSCYDISSLHFGFHDNGVYKPAKLQVTFQEELWGHPVQWEDIDVVFESTLK